MHPLTLEELRERLKSLDEIMFADPMKRLGPLDILHRMGRVEEPNTLA